MMNEAKGIPDEEPVKFEDDDVIDTELKDVELQLKGQETNDGLYKDDTSDNPPPRRFRRSHLIVGLLVIGVIIFIVGITAGVEVEKVEKRKQKKVANDNEKKIKNDVKPPNSCAATTLLCDTDDVTNNWMQLNSYVHGTDAQDYTGYAVSLSCDGSMMAVGTPRGDTDSKNAGYVRVYEMDQSTENWKQIANDIEGENESDQFGSSLSLSGDGYRLAVGSRFNDNKAVNAGHVRIYELNRAIHTWFHLGTIEGEWGGDQAGHSVSLSHDGNRVAIGAPANNATGIEAGHARVFELTLNPEGGLEWEKLGQDLDGIASGDRAGRAVTLSGDGNRVAVGSYNNDGLNSTKEDAGHVRVFEYISAYKSWTMVGGEISGYEAGDWFGLSLSFSYDGSVLAIGAPGNNVWPGTTSVYHYDGNAWTRLGQVLDGGYSVDITGDGKRVVTGSYKGSHNGLNSGFTIVWEYDGNNWNRVGDFVSGYAGEMSGSSVAISDDGMRIISSSPAYDDFNGVEDVGRVRTYDFC